MAKTEFDPHDPFDLVGTPVPVEDGHDSLAEMALCFVAEFVNMGWNDKKVMSMFKKSAYRGPHMVFRLKGEEYVRQLIEQARESHAALMKRLLKDNVREEA